MKRIILIVLLIKISVVINAQSLKVIKTYPVAGTGGWDYIAINDSKLYVSHGTQVNILQEDTGDSIGCIQNTNGVHGIAFDNELKRGYTSNGKSNNVTVFDLNTNDSITCIATGENPDAILYEPFTKTIITCNGRSKDLSVIDPKTNTVIATIPVGGKPEAPASDGMGKLFVNIEDRNEIVAIDLARHVVLNHWSLEPGEEPTGLAYDKNTKRLFAACDKLLVVVDAGNGNIISKLPIGEGADGVVFDVNNNLIYTSNGEGTITVVKAVNANTYNVVGNYPTTRGARTLTMNYNTQILYLPTADFEAATEPNGRHKIKPGTFRVLVVK
jgi:YVTN family beta-propeller protein